MLRRTHTAFAAAIVFLVCSAAPAQARRAFVTDEFEITLRTGPTNTNKIVRMLSTGTRVDVLEEADGWAKVQADGKEGWVLQRYLTPDTPKAVLIDSLTKKNTRLADRAEKAVSELEAAKAEIKELRSQLGTTSKELTQVSQSYERLSADAADVAKLRKSYQQATSELSSATAEVEELKLDNAQLVDQTKLSWFLYGAGVVIFSWLVGFIFGRSGKRRKGSLYS